MDGDLEWLESSLIAFTNIVLLSILMKHASGKVLL